MREWMPTKEQSGCNSCMYRQEYAHTNQSNGEHAEGTEMWGESSDQRQVMGRLWRYHDWGEGSFVLATHKPLAHMK